jgi:hypothetical protein
VAPQAQRSHVRSKVDQLQQKLRTEPDQAKWEDFWGWIKYAAASGYKPGYPVAQYKEKYGVYPPRHWSDEAAKAFSADADWQQRLADRERANATIRDRNERPF